LIFCAVVCAVDSDGEVGLGGPSCALGVCVAYCVGDLVGSGGA